MARQKRSDDVGVSRAGGRTAPKGRDAARVRLCDRVGCNNPGDRPAPKSPNSRERWYFCEAHAAEYNKNWNYFAGLSPEEAARRAAEEESGASAFRKSAQWQWAGPGDGSRSRDEMRALDVLQLDAADGRLPVQIVAQACADRHHEELFSAEPDAQSACPRRTVNHQAPRPRPSGGGTAFVDCFQVYLHNMFNLRKVEGKNKCAFTLLPQGIT